MPNSVLSITIMVVPPTPLPLLVAPPAPTTVTALSGTKRVDLGWSSVPLAASFTVNRGTTPGGEVPLATNLIYPTYADTSVTSGQIYYYTITAVNAAGASSPSTEVSVTPA